MYKILRRESLHKVLPRIIVCAVLFLALLGVAGNGLIHLIAGPTDFSEVDPTDMDGKYVTFDASQIIVAFADLTSSNSDGDSKTMKTYYLLPVGDGKYMAVMDKKEKNNGVITRAMAQSKDYYLGDLTTLTKLGNVSGTVKALDDDMVGYMTDCIDNYALPGYVEGVDSSALIVPYQVDLNVVGFLPEVWVIVLGIGALIFLLLLIAQLVVLFAGCYQKRVRAVVGDDSDGFESAVKIEQVRVGDYIWYSKGPGSRALQTSDVVWGYAMPEPMVVSKYRWPVALYNSEQELTRINFMEQSNCEKFLKTIAAEGHPFLMGYTSETAQKFQSDFEGFLEDAGKAAEAYQN